MTHKESTTETRHTIPVNSAGSDGDAVFYLLWQCPKEGLKSIAEFINKRPWKQSEWKRRCSSVIRIKQIVQNYRSNELFFGFAFETLFLVMRQYYMSKRRKINQSKYSMQLRIKIYIVYGT